jgi:uncharacterized protein YecE (DUF72 family)
MSEWTRDKLGAELSRLAADGIFFGTSSWKYSGWRGHIYTDDRYIYRGTFSENRFDRLCLSEYAEVFPTVCVDAAYYKFPEEKWLDGMVSQVGEGFRFALKVTDLITIKNFPNLPRFGPRAGQGNPEFLNCESFQKNFLTPCEPFRENIGLLIFEFSRFSNADYSRGRDFLTDLESFLRALPKGWPYGVEIRNPGFLRAEYFAVLSQYNVCHVFNSWQGMPAIGEQMEHPEAFAHSSLVAGRFLLKPGRKYEQAVKMFQPYAEVREVYPEGRAAGAALAAEAKAQKKRAYIYVNNRFEGNAPATIAAMVERLHQKEELRMDRPQFPTSQSR